MRKRAIGASNNEPFNSIRAPCIVWSLGPANRLYVRRYWPRSLPTLTASYHEPGSCVLNHIVAALLSINGIKRIALLASERDQEPTWCNGLCIRAQCFGTTNLQGEVLVARISSQKWAKIVTQSVLSNVFLKLEGNLGLLVLTTRTSCKITPGPLNIVPSR